MIRALLCLPLSIQLLVAQEASPPSSAHDREYWRSIVRSDYALPDGATAYPLIVELGGLLGSTDPELRDDFAYGIPVAWIHRDKRLSATELDALRRLWQANLATGIGRTGDESVLLRSFSALDLSILAAHDLEQPFLAPGAFQELLTAALDYLAQEKDVRGFVPGSGWHHSTAHTADLLKFLARSPRLAPADQARILAAISAKLSSAGAVYTWGEDERLARAILSLVKRPDLDRAGLDGWIDERAAAWAATWKATPFDPARFVAAQNGKNVLTSLFALVSGAEAFPARDTLRDGLLGALRRM